MTETAIFAYADMEVSRSNRSYSKNSCVNELPDFDFRAVSLSRSSCEQLARIYEAVRVTGSNAASERTGLRNLLIENCFDPIRGIYVPTSPHVFLPAKLPTVSEEISRISTPISAIFPFGAVYFTNPLVIPQGYGTAVFNPANAPAPKTRLTNIGFLIVTLEYDCSNVAEFEEILSWTRGDIDRSLFARVDRELCKLAEYRGYCIVLSGGRSIHFHCLFSTVHLNNAPYNSSAELRHQTFQNDSALMENAHRIYWDHVNAVFKSVLNPSLSSDSKLRQATQWRRTPWGIRILDKIPTFLDYPKVLIFRSLLFGKI